MRGGRIHEKAAASLSGRAVSAADGLRGGAHGGVHALEDITDADIVANEMGYSAVLWQSYSDTFSCEASWESFRGVEYLWTLPGNEARTVHVTYAEQECGDYRVVLVLPDDTVVELEEGENTVEVPEGSTWMAVAAAGGGGAFTAQWES